MSSWPRWSRVSRRATAVVLAALLLGACAQGSEPDAGPPLTTTTAAPAEPSTTTTTEAPPPPPPTGPARAIVTAKGVVAPVLAVEVGGWRVRTPCGKEAVVTKGRPVSAATVVLDAGHGGEEYGAVSPDGEVREKHVNLGVATEAAKILEAQGVPTLLTRYTDIRITIEGRAAIVKALEPKAFVSIHHNAEPDGPRPGPGSETYYQHASAESKRLSGLIYEDVVRTLSHYQIAWVGDTDAGVKYRRSSSGDDYYGILRRTQGVPASLAELAFISNPPEAELLRDPAFQRVEAEAVAAGILRFLRTSDPGSGYVEGYTRTAPAGPGGGSSGCTDPPLE